MLDKNRTDRDASYLEFVRSLGCLVCGRPAEAHHQAVRGQGSVGAKCSDYRALPLCHDHHCGGGTEAQPGSVHTMGWSFWERYGIDPDVAVAQLNQKFFWGGNYGESE